MFTLIRIKNNNLFDLAATRYDDYDNALAAMIDEYNEVVNKKRFACEGTYAVCADGSDNYAYVRVEDPKCSTGSYARIVESYHWSVVELEEADD